MKMRTEAIYATFLKRVADGRGLPLETVKEIAQGRVYAGNRALELGLVDRLAGLDEAIDAAAASNRHWSNSSKTSSVKKRPKASKPQ